MKKNAKRFLPLKHQSPSEQRSGLIHFRRMGQLESAAEVEAVRLLGIDRRPEFAFGFADPDCFVWIQTETIKLLAGRNLSLKVAPFDLMDASLKQKAIQGDRVCQLLWLLDEIGEFLASAPSPERDLEFLDVLGCIVKFPFDGQLLHGTPAVGQFLDSVSTGELTIDLAYLSWSKKQASRGRRIISINALKTSYLFLRAVEIMAEDHLRKYAAQLVIFRNSFKND